MLRRDHMLPPGSVDDTQTPPLLLTHLFPVLTYSPSASYTPRRVLLPLMLRQRPLFLHDASTASSQPISILPALD